MRYIGPRGALAIASVALIAACGSASTSAPALPAQGGGTSSSSSSTSSDLTAAAVAAVQAAFAADEGPVTSAISDVCGASDLPGFKAAFTKLANALDDFDQRLLAVTYPSEAAADGKQLAKDMSALSSVVRSMSSASSELEMYQSLSTFRQEAASVAADETILRHDLGLPPTTQASSSCSS